MRPLMLGATALLTLAPAALAVEPTPARRARAVFCARAPRLDGRLDDAAWQRAAPFDDFVERKPTLHATPPVRTIVRVVFDAHAIYVGVRCEDDRPDDVVGRTKVRDDFALFSDDAVSLKFDPQNDRRTTLGFATNPAGAQLDYRGVNESDFLVEYDSQWRVRTSRDGGGWSAEFRIPFAALGIDPGDPPETIGFDVSRDHARRSATYDWALLPPPFSPIAASRYGTLGGFEALAERAAGSILRNVAIVPYAVTGLRIEDGERDSLLNGGGDIKADLGPFHGHLSLNTDFSQVDLDNQVVNLTRFGLFLPEKRDFFLGDLEVFSFGRSGETQPFYTRRIGLDDDGEVPIVSGIKIVGQPAGALFRMTVGALYDHVRFEALPDFESLVVNGRLAFGLTRALGYHLYAGYNLLGDVLQLQSRLRWSYARGSDLFLVSQVDLDDDTALPTFVSLAAKSSFRWSP